MSAIDVIEAVRNARNAPEPVICERFDNLGRNGAPRRIGIMGGTSILFIMVISFAQSKFARILASRYYFYSNGTARF